MESTCRGGANSPLLDLAENLAGGACERRVAGQQAVKGRAEAVDVGVRAEPIEIAGGLLGAHVGRRPHR